MCPYASLWETRKRVRRKSGHSEQEFVASFINTDFNLTITYWADDDFSWTINLIQDKKYFNAQIYLTIDYNKNWKYNGYR